MSLSVKTDIRNNWLDTIANAIDAGTGPGVLEFYDGSRPATGGTETTLLGTVTCSEPCAPAATNGELTFNSFVDDDNTAADGVATWARFKDSGGNFVADVDVGESGSGADIILNSTNITAGGILRVNSGTITTGNA